jgi:DNA (cytosine-5)-methyltransferase 1
MRVLDLFSGAGGAAMGLHRAFPEAEIVGVDIKDQPRYPFTFVQGDALAFPLGGFDLIWASPPCQGYSWCSHIHHCQKRPYSRLIEVVRESLLASGIPFVIENVIGAPLINPIILCGTYFNLPLRRHRQFESSFPIQNGHACNHGADFGVYAGKITRVGTRAAAYVAGSGRTHYRPQTTTRADGQVAMGIDWMTIEEMSQAIPPAYSEYIGRQFIKSVSQPVEEAAR